MGYLDVSSLVGGVAAGAAALLGGASCALGQAGGAAEGAGPAMPDKSRYTLLDPTPRELMREMSTDRPDTTESAYTVDAGHVQLELSFMDWGQDRADGVRTRSLAVAPMLVKIGLLNNVDLQVGIDPYTRVEERSGDGTSTISGFGDTVVRLKVNLWGNDETEEGSTALAVMPFVTIPTARDGLGSEKVEGGVIVPLSIALPGGFDLGTMVEFDFNRSGSDDRYVVDFVHTVTVGHALVGELNGYVEYAGFANLSHDEEYRGYFDLGLTYGVSADVQLDLGGRIGLTSAADDVGIFAGISLRF